MDRSSRQKVNNEIQALNDTLDLMDSIDICRGFNPKASEYTFFSSAHGTFSRIDHMLGHKASLGKFKKNWNHIKHLFQAQRYEIRNQLHEKNLQETYKHVEAKQDATKQPMDHWRNQRGNKKKYLETSESKNYILNPTEHSKKNFKREVYSDTSLSQGTKKNISNKQPNLTPKATREGGTNKT